MPLPRPSGVPMVLSLNSKECDQHQFNEWIEARRQLWRAQREQRNAWREEQMMAIQPVRMASGVAYQLNQR